MVNVTMTAAPAILAATYKAGKSEFLEALNPASSIKRESIGVIVTQGRKIKASHLVTSMLTKWHELQELRKQAILDLVCHRSIHSMAFKNHDEVIGHILTMKTDASS